jgi:hypothetical protein
MRSDVVSGMVVWDRNIVKVENYDEVEELERLEQQDMTQIFKKRDAVPKSVHSFYV